MLFSDQQLDGGRKPPRSLGDELNLRSCELVECQANEGLRGATAPEVVAEILSRRRIPRALYRLQLNRTFTFAEAGQLVAYLAELGISDCYTSPIQKARPGSLHGYDICDHGRINPELGGEKDFETFSRTLREANLGLILDIVPNHMGIGHRCNGWWMDVLENGPGSVVASYFDIDWDPVNPDLKNKVLLPWLGNQYGTVLEKGEIRLAYENGAFLLYYFDLRLPVAPRTYPMLLEEPVESLARTLGPEHDHVLELRSILTALSYLPPRMALPPEKMAERNREKEIIKRRLAAVVSACPELHAAIGETVSVFNGRVGDRRSFDRLDQLLEQQAYRLAYWRVAAEEINYRRFFDINELAAIRTEIPQVFQATHHLIFRLLSEGKISGVRVDHPDGLWNPTDYFCRLQVNYLLRRAHAVAGQQRQLPGLEEEVNRRLEECARSALAGTPTWPLYVVAEKILGDNEPLPQGWAVHGTTGYDFLNLVNGLFVDGRNAEAFSTLYDRFIGQSLNFGAMIISSQRMILRVSMTSELNALGHELDRISERNRSYRDFTLNSLTLAIREVISCLFIYRTYITGPDGVSERDRRFIREAVELAKTENPRLAEAVFDFVRDTLLLDNLQEFREADRPRVLNWVMKFQQLTGPVIAKALEDTSFYIYNRLVSLNEVGGNPSVFGIQAATFHEQNRLRQASWAHSLLTTSTHDTKRSEDVRARINVLSEMPAEWEAAVLRWSQMNAPRKQIVEHQPAPDRNDEYLLYQTLIGAWPIEESPSNFGAFRQRIADYMLKATKEAKVHTSWINPIQEYDDAVRNFVLGILSDDADGGFLTDFRSFQRTVAHAGYFNSLSQLVLKMTCPGVPDLYQGNELWDFSLVDPDNRRPVDYQLRQTALALLKERVSACGQDLGTLAEELLACVHDGRIKLYTIWRMLLLRRQQEALFRDGSYLPVQVEGERKDHVCALGRITADRVVLVVVPRLIVGLLRGAEQPPVGNEVWRDTWLALPVEVTGSKYRHLFTGDLISVQEREGRRVLRMTEVLSRFPVAILLDDGLTTGVIAPDARSTDGVL